MTPTRKVKRALMYERFKPLVEACTTTARTGCSPAKRAMVKPERVANKAQREEQHVQESFARALVGGLAPPLRAPAPAQDYVVGITAALTGPPASTYAPAIEALRIYLDRVNAAGGVNGKKVNLVIQDDCAQPSKAAANAKKLLTQDNAVLMINASLSSTYAPVIAEAKNAGVPLLFAASSARRASIRRPPRQFCTTAFRVELSTAARRSPSSRRPRRSR